MFITLIRGLTQIGKRVEIIFFSKFVMPYVLKHGPVSVNLILKWIFIFLHFNNFSNY